MSTRIRPRPAGRPGAGSADAYVRDGRAHATTPHRPTPRLSTADRRACDAYYTTDGTQAVLTAGGMTVTEHDSGRHWVITGRGLRIGHWPSTGTWRVYGRSWQSSASAVIAAIDAGRITMPTDARQATCRRCGGAIWWITTDRGRPMPVEADGDAHIGRCTGGAS